jgi:hypothetical protein
VVVQFARRVLRKGIEQDDVRTSLRRVIDQVLEYGFDVLQAFVKAPFRGDCYICGPDQEAEALQAGC